MKISDKTISILKNFHQINPSLLVREGSEIATKSKGSMMGVATVPDHFPQEFGIGDLAQFIGCLSLFSEPDLTFHGQYVTINQGNQQIRFTFCEPQAINTPSRTSLPMQDVVATFKLKSSDIKGLARSSGLLKTPEFRIVSEGGNLVIKTCDSKNASGNEYSVIGAETDNSFNYLFDKEAITTMLEYDYEVTLAKNGLVKFENETVTYYMAGKATK